MFRIPGHCATPVTGALNLPGEESLLRGYPATPGSQQGFANYVAHDAAGGRVVEHWSRELEWACR